MRRLFVTEFVTLDGVMEAPGGEPSHPFTNWVTDYADPEMMAWKEQETMASDLLLLGRVTYESFAGAWPSYEGEMAEKMNSMPKVVVSNTLTDPEWTNTTVLSGDLASGVQALKESGGGDIQVAGSHQLVHGLLDNDLVDELRLMVFPLTIGSGLQVFPTTTKKTRWRIAASQTFANDVRVDTWIPTEVITL